MKVKALLLTLLTLASVGVFAQGEDPQLRRQMQDLYARWDKQVAAGNFSALMNHLHPNFVHVDTEGKRTTLSQMRAQMNAMRNEVREMKSTTSVKHVRRHADEAAVWIEVVSTYSENRGGRWVKMKTTNRFAHTLKQTPSGWKITYSQALPLNEPWSFKTGG